MVETFAWPDGSVYLWTGIEAAAVVGYATQTNAQFVHGWANVGPTIGGTYSDHLTGKRVNVSLTLNYHPGSVAQTMFEAATAVHMELRHLDGVGGSAGYLLYSGRFDSVTPAGDERSVYTLAATYHANSWSAY